MADRRLTENPPACPGFSLLDRVLLGLCAIAVILTALLLYAVPALAHGEYAWIMKYSNGTQSCCHPSDSVPISHADANAARVGTVIVAPFPTGPVAVVVRKIYQTEDEQGRAWITTYGCLFRVFGS